MRHSGRSPRHPGRTTDRGRGGSMGSLIRFFGSLIGIIFLIGLLVVVGLLALIF